jgi:hypothetical protein
MEIKALPCHLSVERNLNNLIGENRSPFIREMISMKLQISRQLPLRPLLQRHIHFDKVFPGLLTYLLQNHVTQDSGKVLPVDQLNLILLRLTGVIPKKEAM